MSTAPTITKGAPTPLDPGNGLPNDPQSRLGHIRELFDISSKWMQDNYWDEFAEVFRASRCRTAPIMVTDKNGNKTEDKNRTNVCMPELNLIIKRKTARLTANPPTLNYYVPGDDPEMLAERLTARAYYEYDRSGEAIEFRRGVQQANTFGYNYFKTFHDTVDVVRQMRYRTEKMRDRATFMRLQGANQEEIQNAVESQGQDLSDAEVASALQLHGDELRGSMPMTMYEGPVTKCRFIGDVLLEPGCLTLNDSAFVLEDYKETALWLTKMAGKSYTDPESGLQVPIFDKDAINDLMAQDTELRHDKHENLKRILRDAVQMNHPYLANRLLPQKRFRITEFHAPDKDGRLWIEYIGNDSVYLGKQVYPFDLWGRWVYTEFVPWPDLIGAIGDSSPRLLRFLHAMHNAAVGQRNDLISNQLRRTYIAATEADIPEKMLERKFGKILVIQSGNPAGFRPLDEPDVPASAWQTEAQIVSEMMRAEPAIGAVESGTEANPQAGKTATTAILAAKSSDALTQFELDGLNLCLKELGEKKLEIHRQLADGPIPVPNRPQYVKSEALSQRYGKTSLIEIDPYEIQDPMITVEPVAGSTLAVDDELRAGKIQSVYQMAETDPTIWNKYEVAKLVLTTIKGIGSTDKLLRDPSEQAPAGPKVGVNVSVPFDKLQPDTQNEILQMLGLPPSQDATAKGQIDAVIHAAKGANAASELASPAEVPGDVLSRTTKAVQDRISGTV